MDEQAQDPAHDGIRMWAERARGQLAEVVFMGVRVDLENPEHVLACYWAVRQELRDQEKVNRMLMDMLTGKRSAPRRRWWNLFGGG